jgi:D-alanyl-D-alanine carboxypeptidase
MELASAGSEPVTLPPQRTAAPAPQRPAPFTNGVLAHANVATPGSTEPMAPVKVKTVAVKAGVKMASAGPVNAPATTSALASSAKNESRFEMPPQPANHGTGNGILGVLPASRANAMAYADTAPRQVPSQIAQPSVIQENGAVKTAVRTGWIIQVGALESEAEARKRLDAAREHASGLLDKADRFTETVDKGDKRLYRARFAGLDRGKAEAACRTLKRSEISCIAIKN